MPALRWGSARQLPASRPAEAGSLITSCPPQAPPQSHLVPGAVWGGQGSREGVGSCTPMGSPCSDRHSSILQAPWDKQSGAAPSPPAAGPPSRQGLGWGGERREKPPEFHLQAPSGNIGDFCSPVTRRDRQ